MEQMEASAKVTTPSSEGNFGACILVLVTFVLMFSFDFPKAQQMVLMALILVVSGVCVFLGTLCLRDRRERRQG